MGRLKRKNRESHNRKEKNIILIGAEGDNCYRYAILS